MQPCQTATAIQQQQKFKELPLVADLDLPFNTTDYSRSNALTHTYVQQPALLQVNEAQICIFSLQPAHEESKCK